MNAPGPMPPAPHIPPTARIKAYLRARPILCLALLTPGIPEYLSGSSSPVVLLESPVLFGIFLLANLGLYLAGVLLIREARVRWQLGWASVITLGVAYGIAEEGLALDTLFNLHAAPVTASSAFHFVGVNWGWTSQILVFHALFSVALPLLILELALPELKGRRLLTTRGLYWTLAAYLSTIGIAGVLLARFEYWMGFPVLVGSLAAIAGLLLLARELPTDAIHPAQGPPRASPMRFFLLGLATFPGIILLPVLAAYTGIPGLAFVLLAPGIATALLATLVRNLGTVRPQLSLAAYSAGAVLPIIGFGFLFAFRFPVGLPLVALVDALAIGFFWKLCQRYAQAPPAVVPGSRPLPG
jgi:hypothetical protein